MIGNKKLITINHLGLQYEAIIYPLAPSFDVEWAEIYSCDVFKPTKNIKLFPVCGTTS